MLAIMALKTNPPVIMPAMAHTRSALVLAGKSP
jgi:hypothetical protein